MSLVLFKITWSMVGTAFIMVRLLLHTSVPSWCPSFGVMHACQVSSMSNTISLSKSISPVLLEATDV